MAISNYTELQTAVGNWLNRSDLTARIPEFIALAEAKIKRRLRRKTTVAEVTLSAETTTLPSDASELRSVRLKTSTTWWNRPLDVCTKQIFDSFRSEYEPTGRPRKAAVLGTTLYVLPAPDQSYTAEVTYFEALSPLTSGNPTNSVLTEAPDLYLYGALCEAADYLEDDERVGKWEQKFEKALSELEIAREREEVGPSPQPMGLPVVF